MEKINVPRGVMEQLLQNAEDYALAMMATATPEQIENVRKQNELSTEVWKFARIAAGNHDAIWKTANFAGRIKCRFDFGARHKICSLRKRLFLCQTYLKPTKT